MRPGLANIGNKQKYYNGRNPDITGHLHLPTPSIMFDLPPTPAYNLPIGSK